MSGAYSRGPVSGPMRRDAEWLGLAAAPTFAIMALLTGVLGGGTMAMTCGVEPSFLGGMVPMYLLMSGFHSAPWLKLIADRRSRGNRKLKS
jgi:hypothetical protein